jgi:metallo-beta-lactamase family protein
MRIKFIGAAQGVTGSMHLLETPAGTILIDCGMFQGRREESRQKNSKMPAEAVGADAVILTHAHIDHSGSLPTLVKQGFAGNIWATPATRDLCAYMLRDSARIQEGDAEYLNKKFGEDPEWVPIRPTYTEEDAVTAMTRFMSAAYDRRFQPLPGVTATFLDAGHILGSAGVMLELEERGRKRRLMFSGDIGRPRMPILRDPVLPRPPLDAVLMESTYGNRAHGDVKAMHDDLERVVKETAGRGGKIVIPAFAVGRTQEILYVLAELRRDGRLPDIPVFIDSPLSVNVTSVFKLHPDCFDAETRAHMEEFGSLFDWDGVRFVSAREESIRLNSVREPCIIISSSGMCEAGRVLHHIRNNCEDPKNTIVIVGFQAQHTLGRRIVEKRPRIRVLGVERDLRAQVVVMNAFSAHADKDDLRAYAHSCGTETPVYLVHGEPESQEALMATLRGDGFRRCEMPAPGTEIEL